MSKDRTSQAGEDSVPWWRWVGPWVDAAVRLLSDLWR
jgi:hypothetical protein